MTEDHHIDIFAGLDDTDIIAAVKVWAGDSDFILSELCKMLMLRSLYQVEISNDPPNEKFITHLVDSAITKYNLPVELIDYFVFKDTITNNAYKPGEGSIGILMKDGNVQDITKASDNSNLEALAKTVKKYILCYTKNLF